MIEFKRIVCPGCGMSTWHGAGCSLPGCELYGEECTSCAGRQCDESESAGCHCPCRGCKFHCGACWCDPCQPLVATI